LRRASFISRQAWLQIPAAKPQPVGLRAKFAASVQHGTCRHRLGTWKTPALFWPSHRHFSRTAPSCQQTAGATREQIVRVFIDAHRACAASSPADDPPQSNPMNGTPTFLAASPSKRVSPTTTHSWASTGEICWSAAKPGAALALSMTEGALGGHDYQKAAWKSGRVHPGWAVSPKLGPPSAPLLRTQQKQRRRV
jgi:hypothetical protein